MFRVKLGSALEPRRREPSTSPVPDEITEGLGDGGGGGENCNTAILLLWEDRPYITLISNRS